MKLKQTSSYSIEEEIRMRLNDRLGRQPVDELEWGDLIEQGYVADVSLAGPPIDESGIDELEIRVRVVRKRATHAAKPARKLDSAAEQRKRKRKREEPAPGWLREAAAAVTLAAEVADYPEVQAFRADVLGGQLLDEDYLVEWLQQRAREEMHPDLWLTNSVVPLSHVKEVLAEVVAALERQYDDLPRDTADALLPVSLTVGFDPRQIRQVTPLYLSCTVRDPETKRRSVYQCLTSPDGALERLQRHGESLAALCSWSEPEAVRFILTGITPSLPRIRHSTRFSRQSIRIQLSIDPAATPDEVKDFYQRVREPMIHRTRVHDAKHMFLALFMERYPRREGESWRQYLLRWNQWCRPDHADWAYSSDQDGHFGRDCRHVREHVRWLDCKVPIPRWLPQKIEGLEPEPGTDGGLLKEVGGDSSAEKAYVLLRRYGSGAAREMVLYARTAHEVRDSDEQGQEQVEASTHGEARQ